MFNMRGSRVSTLRKNNKNTAYRQNSIGHILEFVPLLTFGTVRPAMYAAQCGCVSLYFRWNCQLHRNGVRAPFSAKHTG